MSGIPAVVSTAPVDSTIAWTTEDLHAWQILRPLLDAGGYLPWSSGAMRPSGLVDVCNEIVLGGRTEVVELGSGASTTLLARLLRARGGRLTAVEHHGQWAELVTRELAREALDSVATVVHAPLTGAEDRDTGLPWYDADALTAVAGGASIDLLIVDGPPAYADGHELARWPALPAFLDRLTPDSVVVLDDIDRDGEQAVLARWEHATAFRFEQRSSGIAIGRRVPTVRA